MNKIKMGLLLVICSLTLTGCFKNDNMENIDIVVTTYPIENLVNKLYGNKSTIESIYPAGTNIKDYTLTEKKIKQYTKNDFFVYNGLTDEKNIAASFLNKNDSLRIIDVTKGISIQRDPEELWLSPSNYLMLAQNIKNSLTSYITSTVVLNEVQTSYDNLKLTISEYDAEFKTIKENSNNPVIIAGNDVFKFLEKYGFIVYSVEDNDLFDNNDYNNAKNEINKKSVSYIFLLKDDAIDANTQKMIDAGLKEVYINPLTTRTDSEIDSNYNYEDMMADFLEKIKTEVYN